MREYALVAVPDIALFNGMFLDNCRLVDIERATGLPAVTVMPSPASLREIATWGEERVSDVG